MRVKKELNIQIGERVKLSREGYGLTQEQLAEAIDVSPQYISDLERGVVGISIPTLKRLCTHLGVSSDRILFDRKTEQFSVAVGEKCRGCPTASSGSCWISLTCFWPPWRRNGRRKLCDCCRLPHN